MTKMDAAEKAAQRKRLTPPDAAAALREIAEGLRHKAALLSVKGMIDTEIHNLDVLAAAMDGGMS